MSGSEILIFLLFGCGFVYWVSAIRCKDLAILAARRECRLHDVQLLDHTVFQVWISLRRNDLGLLRIWRRYRFDYSIDGLERESGELILLGRQVVGVWLSPRFPTVH